VVFFAYIGFDAVFHGGARGQESTERTCQLACRIIDRMHHSVHRSLRAADRQQWHYSHLNIGAPVVAGHSSGPASNGS